MCNQNPKIEGHSMYGRKKKNKRTNIGLQNTAEN